MPERDEAGDRLATMLQHAAASAEGKTEFTFGNVKAPDEATKARREAMEVKKKAAEPLARCVAVGGPRSVSTGALTTSGRARKIPNDLKVSTRHAQPRCTGRGDHWQCQ